MIVLYAYIAVNVVVLLWLLAALVVGSEHDREDTP